MPTGPSELVNLSLTGFCIASSSQLKLTFPIMEPGLSVTSRQGVGPDWKRSLFLGLAHLSRGFTHLRQKYIPVYVCVCLCVHRLEVDVGCFPPYSLTYCTEVVSYLNPKLSDLPSLSSQLAVGLPHLCLSASHILGLSLPSISMGARHLDSSPQACMASSLPDEPSPQPLPMPLHNTVLQCYFLVSVVVAPRLFFWPSPWSFIKP